MGTGWYFSSAEAPSIAFSKGYALWSKMYSSRKCEHFEAFKAKERRRRRRKLDRSWGDSDDKQAAVLLSGSKENVFSEWMWDKKSPEDYGEENLALNLTYVSAYLQTFTILKDSRANLFSTAADEKFLCRLIYMVATLSQVCSLLPWALILKRAAMAEEKAGKLSVERILLRIRWAVPLGTHCGRWIYNCYK